MQGSYFAIIAVYGLLTGFSIILANSMGQKRRSVLHTFKKHTKQSEWQHWPHGFI